MGPNCTLSTFFFFEKKMNRGVKKNRQAIFCIVCNKHPIVYLRL